MTVPETQFYRMELERVLREMAFAVQGYEMGEGARANVRTVEGRQVLVECVNDGFMVSLDDQLREGSSGGMETEWVVRRSSRQRLQHLSHRPTHRQQTNLPRQQPFPLRQTSTTPGQRYTTPWTLC